MVDEVTTQSWLTRLMNSFLGVLFGIALIIGAFYYIFWNEGTGLHTAQSLTQAQQNLIEIPSSPINPNNNLRVVYFSGLATTNDILKDDLLGIAETAIKLNRNVQMYQWQENESSHSTNQMGGSQQNVTSYTYEQVWSNDVINSTTFKEQAGHQNPNRMPIVSSEQQAQLVKVGDFILPAALIAKIDGATSVDLTKINITALQQHIGKPLQRNDQEIYIGANPEAPQIGDEIITVTETLPQTVSIVAQQAQDTLQAYVAPAGKKIFMLATGQESSQQMFLDAANSNKLWTILNRLFSFLIMFFGVSLLMGPLVILADVIPLLGSIVGLSTSLIAFVLASGLWGTGEVLALVAIRPIWIVGLIAIVAVICLALFSRNKQQ